MTQSLRQYSLLLILGLATILLATPALGQTEIRTYRLENRPADDVAGQVRELYQGAPVTITSRGQQLVVRGEPRLLDEIGTLVNTLDVAPVQMRITVRTREDFGGKQSGGGVTTSGNGVGVTVERRETSTGSSRERTLMVQDGQTAQISSGQIRTLPFAIQGGRNPAALLEQVETRSGFLVSPRKISDQSIDLSIVSFEEDPAQLKGYQTEALITQRRVKPGQWVSLGSTSTHATDSHAGLVYRANSRQSQNHRFEVRVELLP